MLHLDILLLPVILLVCSPARRLPFCITDSQFMFGPPSMIFLFLNILFSNFKRSLWTMVEFTGYKDTSESTNTNFLKLFLPTMSIRLWIKYIRSIIITQLTPSLWWYTLSFNYTRVTWVGLAGKCSDTLNFMCHGFLSNNFNHSDVSTIEDEEKRLVKHLKRSTI